MPDQAELERRVLLIISGGPGRIAEALAEALEEAVEWNWMEDGVPEGTTIKVYAALEAYNRHKAGKA
jgi:hypothetical protein